MIAQNRVHLERTHYNVYIVPLLDLSFIVWSTDGWLGHWNSSSSSSSSHPPVFHRIPRLLPFPTISNIPSTDRISFFYIYIVRLHTVPVVLSRRSDRSPFTKRSRIIIRPVVLLIKNIYIRDWIVSSKKVQSLFRLLPRAESVLDSVDHDAPLRTEHSLAPSLKPLRSSSPPFTEMSLTPCAVLISSSYLTYSYYLFGFHSK